MVRLKTKKRGNKKKQTTRTECTSDTDTLRGAALTGDEWSPRSSSKHQKKPMCFVCVLLFKTRHLLGLLQGLVILLQHGPSFGGHEAVGRILPLAGHLPHACARDEVIVLMAADKDSFDTSQISGKEQRRGKHQPTITSRIAGCWTGPLGVSAKQAPESEAPLASHTSLLLSDAAACETRPGRRSVLASFWQLIRITHELLCGRRRAAAGQEAPAERAARHVQPFKGDV